MKKLKKRSVVSRLNWRVKKWAPIFLWVSIAILLSVPVMAQRTHLVILGSGNPNPDPEHHGPCVAVIVDTQAYLVDFGEGLVRQAASLSKRYGGLFEALNARRLNIGFLTHLHSDHTLGLPDLLLTPWVMDREKELQLYGPPGLSSMVDHLLEAYSEDIHYRLYSNQPSNDTGWRAQVHEFTGEGLIYSDQLVKVEAFPVTHGTWPHCFGYRFTTPDRVIVISGDAVPSKKVIQYARGADILVHEVYYHQGWERKNAFWKKYHQDNHTSTFELADIATQAQPKLLITYHTLYWGATDQDILDEIQSRYTGKVVIGKDLGIY